MAKFVVEKSGPLVGEVSISGAKNAVLPIMAATVLTDEVCEIYDVPKLRDVDVMCQILRSLGAGVTENYEDHTVVIDGSGIDKSEIPYDL
ncbi:MAG: UDP-N-acetylglucosamine 1-carboxyvinyltransferase, partial [Firmicutes bacterium]|nr:UDP-N-acetylglucosamine 1-carboxyvinyltransferase [Bacillota bacterium]